MRAAVIIFGAIFLTAAAFIPLVNAGDTQVTSSGTTFIRTDPIGNHTAGDIFFINGSTNLPISETISLTFDNVGVLQMPHMKSDTSSFSDEWINLTGIPLSLSGSGNNRWSVNVTEFAIRNLSRFHCFTKVQYSNSDIGCDPNGDHWLVVASHAPDIPVNFDNSAQFFLFPAGTVITKLSVIKSETAVVATAVTQPQKPVSTPQASLPVSLVVVGVCAGILLSDMSGKKK